MANGLVIHIARGRDRHTEVLSLERVRIGPGEDCHVRLAPDTPTDSPLLLELARTNGHYRVAEFDPREFHAQVLMSGALPMSVLEAKIERWIAAKKA